MDKNRHTDRAFDWNRGNWFDGSDSSRETVEVIITSDWAPIRAFDPIVARNPEAVYGDLLPILRRGDLRITNLECPLTDVTAPVWKSGSVLKGLPDHVHGLTAVPFEAVTLANNHVFDYGRGGFRETIRLLDDQGIRRVGAGLTVGEAVRPLIMNVNGVALGILNFSEGEDLTAATQGPGVSGWEPERVADAVRELKRTVDVVLVICHCGVEYIAFPPVYVAEAFQRIAEAGADMVIGHHPHVPQGIQIHHGVPICYSLGNFVFYQETDLIYRKTGFLVKVRMSLSGLEGFTVVPYEILDDRLALLSGAKRRRFLEVLRQVSEPLEDNSRIAEAWNAFLGRYGLEGFKSEIGMLMDTLARDPLKGAAMFRNRIATMQHNQHWIDALTRIIGGTIDDAPEWAMELTEQWLTQTR